ncbi:MAG: hypothetical protein ACLQGP_01280 [Isosphaeraceae bacterium]
MSKLTTVSGDQDVEKPSSREVPRGIGVMLVVAGIGGILLPGPVGTPLLILGGLILYPGAFGRLGVRLGRRFPRVHHYSMRQIDRFLDDLDRRYPFSK